MFPTCRECLNFEGKKFRCQFCFKTDIKIRSFIPRHLEIIDRIINRLVSLLSIMTKKLIKQMGSCPKIVLLEISRR